MRRIVNKKGLLIITGLAVLCLLFRMTIRTQEIDSLRSYETITEFPYHDDNMIFANEKVYIQLREEYSKIDFFGHFESGNLAEYDYYIEKYSQLLDGNNIYYNDDEMRYLKDLDYIDFEDANFDLKDYDYLFFDMDGDDIPELCVTDGVRFYYIFKYLKETDRFVMWAELGSTYYSIMGSNKVGWNHFYEDCKFSQLDKNGEAEYRAAFHQNWADSDNEVKCMVAFPQYRDKQKEIQLTKDMIEQAYYDEAWQFYYFRVTEEQYHELTQDFFAAEKSAEEKRDAVTYTYDELFGS